MDSHVDLDEQTAHLIVQLQLEDLNELSSHRTSEDDDFSLALALYGDDLKAMNDSRTAQSLVHGALAVVEVIKESRLEERQAPEHQRRPLPQADGQSAPVLPTNVTSTAATDDGGIGRNDSTSDDAAILPVAKHQCCACTDEFDLSAVARAPCGHHYCQGCLKHFFTRSLTDETLFPPRCCRQAIPADKLFLGRQLRRDFKARKVEMETVNRTYCHVSGCGKFIPPGSKNIQHQVGRCVSCDGQTCTMCKEAAHVGDCPEDPATKALENTAAQNGWRRCNNCRRIVELASGCNHIKQLLRSEPRFPIATSGPAEKLIVDMASATLWFFG